MYHKLARGYATAYLETLQNIETVEKWFEGRKCTLALRSFEKSTFSKKPGRCVRRLTSALRPAFERPRIGIWERDDKLVAASAIAVAPEVHVFDVSEENRRLFDERSVFLSDLFLTQEYDRHRAQMVSIANISHHALSRIVERELITPDKLNAEVRNILSMARNLGMSFELMPHDPNQAYAFLVPYKGGALPVVTMRINPRSKDASKNGWIMSVRTFLAPEMLKAEDHERMDGYEETLANFALTTDHSEMTLWMKKNARPWKMAAASEDRETLIGSGAL